MWKHTNVLSMCQKVWELRETLLIWRETADLVLADWIFFWLATVCIKLWTAYSISKGCCRQVVSQYRCGICKASKILFSNVVFQTCTLYKPHSTKHQVGRTWKTIQAHGTQGCAERKQSSQISSGCGRVRIIWSDMFAVVCTSRYISIEKKNLQTKNHQSFRICRQWLHSLLSLAAINNWNNYCFFLWCMQSKSERYTYHLRLNTS